MYHSLAKVSCMVIQSLIIEISDVDKIVLKATKEIESFPEEYSGSFRTKLIDKTFSSGKEYNVTLKNIRKSENLNSSDYIQCEFKDDVIEQIYLLEETGYKLEFKGNTNKIHDGKLFCSLKRNESNDIKFKTWDKGGFLNFKSYAGKTFIDIDFDEFLFKIPLEVRSKKIDYNEQYQNMVEDLAEHASNLMLNYKGPIYQSQSLENHRESDYDYFLILTYIFRKENLPSVFDYLSRNLLSTIIADTETKPVNFASNIGINEIINITFNPDKLIEHDTIHIIPHKNKWYVPNEIIEEIHVDTIDNLENRFYKYFLELLEDIIESLLSKISEGYEYEQLLKYKEEVTYYLSSNYFKQISKLDFLPLNSQVLQKKEGYREILKYYFMLEYGTHIKWAGFNNTVKGYQKRLSQMYEMWGFFELLHVIEEITSSKITDELIKYDEKSLSINVEEGKVIESFNSINVNDTEVQIKFMYNKTFNQGSDYPTYSIELRPDFTIELDYNNKRKFIHFDTKYKIYFSNGKESYKYEDIKKMHTYKDAITGTIGSFVLYPGEIKEYYEEDDFGRGVGAFPLKPKNDNDITYDGNKKDIINLIEDLLNKNIK